MADLSALSADELAKKVEAEMPDPTGEGWRYFGASSPGTDALYELVERASERDQAVRERDEWKQAADAEANPRAQGVRSRPRRNHRMSAPYRYTIVISEDAAVKAEKQATEAGWTVEMWIAWLVEDYVPPDELVSDDD